jgi:hypothetical protein
MNIIFGDNIAAIEDKYTVLELDTFRIGADGPVHTAYCVLELIPLDEMALAESMVDLHHNLIQEYRKRNWNYCEQAIENLMGKWNKELDTFYTELQTRIEKLKTLTLTDEWSPIIEKI